MGTGARVAAVAAAALLWAAAAEPSSWRVARGPSAVGFRVSHMLFSEVEGRFTRFHGSVELPGEELEAARIEAEIEVASLRTGHRDRDLHLLSDEFLDVAAHPRIRFVSREVRRTGGEEFEIAGQLTIRGVTREVTLAARSMGRRQTTRGPRLDFEATTTIDRRDYGLVWNRLWEGAAVLGDQVEILLEIALVEGGAPAAAAP